MCEYCDNIKRISFSNDLTDEEKAEWIARETGKELMCDMLESESDIGVSFESLGLTLEDFEKAQSYEISEKDLRSDFKDEKKNEFDAAPTPLYRYESYAYGARGHGKNSRRFCVTVADKSKTSAFRYVDILRLNGSNPGFGSGGSNIYSVFLYRGGSNCKHFWTKYFYEPSTQKLVKAPPGEQPTQIHKGDMPPPNKD
jgi:hypothetical protein